jgi:hypothetical protein
VTDRVVTRDPNITPEKIAYRRQRMKEASERMRRNNLAVKIALAMHSAGPAMTTEEFAKALDDPDYISPSSNPSSTPGTEAHLPDSTNDDGSL